MNLATEGLSSKIQREGIEKGARERERIGQGVEKGIYK